MKKSIVVLLVLAMVTLAQAVGIYSDDFEAYTTVKATANNGNLWFTAALEPMYTPSGWQPYYSWGAERDSLQISDVGGPHTAGNPSGYGDSLGLTNFDGTNAHGVTRALPSAVDLAAGDTVELSIKVNLSAQSTNGFGYMFIGNGFLAGTTSTDTYSGISLNSFGGGAMIQAPLGPEPAISLPGTDAGWQEIKLVIYSAYHEGYEFDTTHMEVFSGPVGGALVSRGVYGSNQLYNPTYMSLNPNLGATYDDLSIVVTPEPATMILLGLGGLFLRKRRVAN